MTDCPLCDLKRLTQWHYQDGEWVICDCLTCGVPMVVYRKHVPSIEDIGVSKVGEMVALARKLFPERREDFKKRSIPRHFHFHMR